MKKYEASLTLQAQQDAAIDVAMEVGQTPTQVEVRDVTPLVRQRQRDARPFAGAARIEQIPVNGRGYQAFLATVPGIDSTGIRASVWDADQHQHDDLRRRSGKRSLGGLGLWTRARTGRPAGDPRGGKQFVREIYAPDDDSADE